MRAVAQAQILEKVAPERVVEAAREVLVLAVGVDANCRLIPD
jgi:hypothetical protein